MIDKQNRKKVTLQFSEEVKGNSEIGPITHAL